LQITPVTVCASEQQNEASGEEERAMLPRCHLRRCSGLLPLPSPAGSSSPAGCCLSSDLSEGFRGMSSPRCISNLMAKEVLLSSQRKYVTTRLCNVSSFSTELMELHSDEPLLHVLFIPGNPGVISFYKDFIEAAYELLEGKNGENGRTFSLHDQIDHKIDFINQELQNSEVPIVMVGHSIGCYICLEIFKRLPQQVKFTIGLYPFLTLNKDSLKQSMIGMAAGSPILCVAISSLSASLGLLPVWLTNGLVRRSLGHSWSSTAVQATCTHLLQYHTMRNVLFMAMTEFEKLSEEPDWAFMRAKQDQIALLFGVDDHWGPLSLFEEVKISRQVPSVALSVEREGHTHAFCCTEAGSLWVANHVVSLIKNLLG
ncbi:hypothetical protein Taro_040952, partial [Colocasia esculenta]|nr:hypothetical protein [Colocasia esculenta]